MPSLLPLPKRCEFKSGFLPAPSAVRLEGPDPQRVALRAGLPERHDASLTVRWRAASRLPTLHQDEAYTLRVAADGAQIDAATIWGALHGLSSLAQLPRENGELPCCEIEDAPRFPWRGLMLDPARHFLSIGCLEDVLDRMWRLKLNVLHLHLTDDQGFRFESAAYPNLASSERYAADELRGLVAYAADRGVRIVPEIDMPGHVTSWLTAYPEWGIEPVAPSRRFGVHPGCLDVTDNGVLSAVRTLLDELMDVFPDSHVHIGGDEVAGLSANLQNDFISEVVEHLRSSGRTPIGWDEVLHPDMPQGLTVQNWRGATTRDRALTAGSDCIVSSGYYLDLFYPLDVHYAFDPAASEEALIHQEDALRDDPRFAHVADGMAWTLGWRKETPLPDGRSEGRILGGEACLWGELVDEDTLPTRLWSRMPALAERFWSGVEVTDADDLRRRWPGWAVPQGEVSELLSLCEPVKWYGRLLGEVALNARIRGQEMPQARPYDAATPLSRPIDFLPPESWAARVVLSDDDASLEARCTAWRAQAGSAPQEYAALFAAIGEACDLVLSRLKGDLSADAARAALLALYKPYGEFLPAVILHLHTRLS